MKKNPLFLRLFLLITTCTFCMSATAQTDGFGGFSLDGSFDTVIDRMGNKYPLQSLAVNDSFRLGDSIVVNKVLSCGSGYFQLYLEPGCGMDDDSNPDDVARRNTLCRVLYDLSQFIHSPLTGSGGKINVWVRNRANVAGAASAMGYASSFYNVPLAAGATGIADNVSWITIHSGSDAYNGVVNPVLFPTSTAGTFFHVITSFDFDDYTWHTDLSNGPLSTEYDLYTVALREMTHALGFASEINSDGTSLGGANYPYYSRYDQHLTTHTGIPLITNTGGCGMYDYTFNPALSSPASILSPNGARCVTDSTNCDTAVQYAGSVNEPVYTPNCYETGYSLSSFEDECTGTPSVANNNVYFTASNATNPGSMKRYLKPEERLAMCDIGYATDSTYGDSAHLNYYNYGSGACAGINVAGVNDGIGSSGVIYYTGAGPIQINGTGLATGTPGLLDNDVNADSIACLTMVTGTGTLSATGGTAGTVITYTPGTGDAGPVLLRYVPVNTAAGKFGNITYVWVYPSLSPTGTACPAQACNLVVNGDFGVVYTCGSYYAGQNSPPIAASLCRWQNYINTPDIYTTGCTTFTNTLFDLMPSTTSWQAVVPFIDNGGTYNVTAVPGTTSFVGLYGGYGTCSGTGYGGEGMQEQLSEPLIPGGEYTIDFYAQVAVDPGNLTSTTYWSQHNIDIQFFVSTGALPAITGGGTCAGAIQYPATALPSITHALTYPDLTAHGFTVNATPIAWKHIVRSFTYNGAAATTAGPQWIQMINASPSTGADDGIASGVNFNDYVFIADVKIIPVMTAPAIETTCSGVSVTLDPNSLVMATGYTSPTDGFAWTPGTDLSCTSCANPIFNATTGSLPAIHTFSVTDVLYGCVDNILVTVDPVPSYSLACNSPCAGNTLDLTASVSGDTYVWTGPLGFGSTLQNPTLSPATTGMSGTYICSVTNTPYHCEITHTVMATVKPLPAAPTVTGTSDICAGGAPATLTATTTTTGAVTYVWAPAGVSCSICNPLVAAPTITTVYTVYATLAGCESPATEYTVNVDNPPVPTIIGYPQICVGTTQTFTGSAPPTGGTATWSSSPATVATVSATGVVTGIATGTAYITYTTIAPAPAYCQSEKVYTVTVITTPAIPTITASAAFAYEGCTIALTGIPGAPSTTTLSGTVTSVAWAVGSGPGMTLGVPGTTALSSTITATAGVSAGTQTISYTLTNMCGTSTGTIAIDIDPLPEIRLITDGPDMCVGDGVDVFAEPTGGTWTSSNTLVATINPGGAAGVGPGTAVLTYSLPVAAGGCIATTTYSVTVFANPVVTITSAPAATGLPPTVIACPSVTLTASETTGDPVYFYVWQPVDAYGTTVTVTPSVTTNYSVTVTDTHYCTATAGIVVEAGIPTFTGGSTTYTICPGNTVTVTVTVPGGTWSTSNAGVAVVDPATGVLTGIGTGTVNVGYDVTTGCGTYSISTTVTVNDGPSISIAGGNYLCMGSSTTISGSPTGGTWAWYPLTSYVSGAVTGGVLSVTAISPGEVYVAYNTAEACVGYATFTVVPNPAVSIVSAPSPIGTPPIISMGCLPSVTMTASVTAGGPGAIYEWSPAAGLSATTSMGVTAAPTVTTTYSVTVVNAEGCQHTTHAEVAISRVPCVCTYVAEGIAFAPLGLTGTLSSAVPAGNYTLSNDLTITSTMSLNKCVIAIAPGVTITVAAGARLTLNDCHLFSCPGSMWQGIVLAQYGSLVLENNNLIEDAAVGVEIYNPFTPAGYTTGAGTGTPLVLSTGPVAASATAGAIFNKNTIGVQIQNYGSIIYEAGITTLHPGLPFVIQNTVFTSRNFYHYHNGAGAINKWPFKWPGTMGADGLKTAWIPTGAMTAYLPPYNIDNPTAFSTSTLTASAYLPVTCNNGQMARIGIDLEGVGWVVNPEEIYPPAKMVIGSVPTIGGKELNMFDNLGYGINTARGQTIVRNCVFMHIHGDGGDDGIQGIAINATSGPAYYTELHVYGTSILNNLFYDCAEGVFTDGLYNATIEYTKMYSTHTTAYWYGPQGSTGIYVRVNDFNNNQINYNSTYNIFYPITHTGNGSILSGQVGIISNTIQATVTPGGSTASGEAVNIGIAVQNLLGSTTWIGQQNINYNYLDQVYNGIYVSGTNYTSQVTTTDNNIIGMVRNTVSPMYYDSDPQVGIEHAATVNGYINSNTITGPGYNSPPVSGTYISPKMEAIHVASTKGEYLCSNIVTNINTGFFFGGTNGPLKWTDNTMINNSYGYALDGIIGPQPGTSLTTGPRTAGNVWTTIAPFLWTGTHWQTYVLSGSSVPTVSPMTVQGTVTLTATQRPVNNFADIPTISNIYSLANGITVSGNPNALCSVPAAGRHTFRRAARKALEYETKKKKKDWIAQMTTWEAMIGDTTLTDSTADDSAAVLIAFHNMADNHSRYKYLAEIAWDIAEHHYTLANEKLSYPIDSLMNSDEDTTTGAKMADDTAANEIVHHYKRYYRLLIRYHEHMLTEADSTEIITLANMCPYVDGTVIYEARALYNVVYRSQMRLFSDLGCEEDHDVESRMAETNAVTSDVANEQGYFLYPNPSNGNISLEQKVADSGPVEAEVLNATGISVYKGVFHFTSGVTRFSMQNKVPGLYLLHLTDSKGNRFMLKFIME